MKRIATIPPDRCFVTTLAQGLWDRVQGDPLQLAGMVVFLPTRRACRHLREAFLRVTGARAALLPRMQPLGDVDEIDLDFAQAGALDDSLPAIEPLRRQMILMKLILKKDKALPLDQAASLAAALGLLLDQAQTEGRDFAELEQLVPAEYAKHWQETLTFLEILTQAWPAVLAQEGCIDPAARRDLVLRTQAQQWEAAPPPFPVIAAGSTGSVPSVARLMSVIAGLPQGEVILPGLDLSMDEESWQALEETHPQFTMKSWLESVKAVRQDVSLWNGTSATNAPRLRLLQEAMRPAAVTEAWRHLTPHDVPPDSFAGLERLELDHLREEADVIAVRLRAALEDEGKTAALVTPDRALAARVAMALGRWGIVADDSGGTPLPNWPVGSFLIDVLKAAAPDASAIAFLSLLKHPLAAAGLDVAECRRLARLAETKIWRGVRRTDGWASAAKAVQDKEPALAAWLQKIAHGVSPFTQNWFTPQPIDVWIDWHLALVQELATTPQESGSQRLWRGEAGEQAAQWFDAWRKASGDFVEVTGASYAVLCASLLRQVTVRPAYGQHPRLSLLGPLEARLLHHDLVILGGLNEGTWPPAPPVDPWLSRPMKKEFGLPLPERRIGQSAHDFVQLCAASHVLITRARRVGGAPSVPSRFVLQLETVLQAAGYATAEDDVLQPTEPWRSWARHLDAPVGALKTMEPPAPCPPLDARPKKLSVTEISTWMRNPYAIYAKHVLKLRKLDDIDADVTAAEHGTVIHKALETFIQRTMTKWPAQPLELLLEEGRKAFEAYEDRPQVMAFWWPRFERIAQWFVVHEKERRAAGIHPLAVEGDGRMTLRGGTFTLTGRADRIDLLPNGRIVMIDYKTGTTPTTTQVMAGYEPQLPLLAMIAAVGGFEAIGPKDSAEVSYWKLQEKDEAKKITTFAANIDKQIEKAREGLERLLETYGDALTPYEAVPKPHLTPRHNDYAHLSRLAEWGRDKEGDA